MFDEPAPTKSESKTKSYKLLTEVLEDLEDIAPLYQGQTINYMIKQISDHLKEHK